MIILLKMKERVFVISSSKVIKQMPIYVSHEDNQLKDLVVSVF